MTAAAKKQTKKPGGKIIVMDAARKFNFDNDVPVPPITRNGRESKYPFAQMEAGQSWLVPTDFFRDDEGNVIPLPLQDTVRRIKGAASNTKASIKKQDRKNVEFRVAACPMNPEQVRVWRTK